MAIIKKGAKGGKKKLGGKALKRKAPVQEPEVESSGSDFDFDQEDDVLEEKKVVIEKEKESEDEGHDSDKELQIALRDGLLKTDRLNYIVQKKRPIINKTAEIREKIAEISKKLPWIETLDVVTQSTLTKEMIDDDFEREMQFYKQAEKAVQMAVPKLLTMGVKVLRPADYYAEMAKSDGHMQRVRTRLLKIQEGKERQEAIRRMREEKKFASKVQKQAIDNKNAEKKKLMEAVKKHKKGMKQQLEDMLNNVKRYNLDQEEDRPSSSRGAGPAAKRGSFGGPNNRSKNFKRQFKSEKFGYGGKKKGMKRNNKESFDSVYDGKPGRGGGRFGGAGRGMASRGRGMGGRGRGRR